MALASFILGLASVGVAFFVHGFNWLAILVGIVGIVCGVKGRQDSSQKGIATAGMIFSTNGQRQKIKANYGALKMISSC